MDEFTRGWLEAINTIRQAVTEAENEGHLFDLDVELMLLEDAAHTSALLRGQPIEGPDGLRYHIRPATHLLH